MIRFLKHLTILLCLALTPTLVYVSLDPYCVFHQTECEDLNASRVQLNRGNYLHRFLTNSEEKPVAFIFGNSRSQAFKTPMFQRTLTAGKSFHFGTNNESLAGIHSKLAFIAGQNIKPKNVLLVLDDELLSKTGINTSFMSMDHPSISGMSAGEYYGAFLGRAYDFKFLTAITDHALFGTWRPYMKKVIRNSEHLDQVNCTTGDVYYGYDIDLRSDSLAYYQKMKDQGAFLPRNPSITNEAFNDQQLKLLNEIEQFLSTSEVWIVVAPGYNQAAISVGQKAQLMAIFGSDRVFDFSGVNPMTSDLAHYYESSHFKPFIAHQILDSLAASR